MSETTSATLIDFLLARYAEAEELLERDDRVYGGDGEVWTVEAHKQVRADIEAKRRIVELHAPDHAWGMWCEECGETTVRWPCPTLRVLALPYADHPDHREEWRA